MNRITLINFIYSVVLGIIAIVNLILAIIFGDAGELYFLVFCSMLGLFLLNCGQLEKIFKSYNNKGLNKFVKFLLSLFGKIGFVICLIMSLVGIIMGAMTVGIVNSNSENKYGFNSEVYQMMLIGFSIIISILLNRSLKSISSISSKNYIYEYLYKYGMMTIFPIVLGLSYLLQLFINYFMIAFLIINAEFIILSIYFKQKTKLIIKRKKLNLVLSWIFIILPMGVSLIFAGALGFFTGDYYILEGFQKFSVIAYSSMLFYPCISFVLFILLYFLTNRILYKKNSEVSMFGYALVPIISYILQVLVFYYWYIGLIAIAVIWVVLTILGLFVEMFSIPTINSSSNNNSSDYKYYEKIDEILGLIKSQHLQLVNYEITGYDAKYIIHIFCSSVDKDYLLNIIREKLPNEIRFHYV